MTMIGSLVLVGGFGLFVIGLYLWWDRYLKASAKHTKYLDLYELYKLNEQLKERGMSFESLDRFEEETFKRKTALERIDARYNTKKAK